MARCVVSLIVVTVAIRVGHETSPTGHLSYSPRLDMYTMVVSTTAVLAEHDSVPLWSVETTFVLYRKSRNTHASWSTCVASTCNRNAKSINPLDVPCLPYVGGV